MKKKNSEAWQKHVAKSRENSDSEVENENKYLEELEKREQDQSEEFEKMVERSRLYNLDEGPVGRGMVEDDPNAI